MEKGSKNAYIKTILTNYKFERSRPPARQTTVTVADVTAKRLNREAMETAVLLTNDRFSERQKSTALFSTALIAAESPPSLKG